MKRFAHFTPDQQEELQHASDNLVRRLIQVICILVVALAISFGYGLKVVADTSHHADTALRTAAQISRERAADAKKIAEMNARKARQSARSAYAACRRQQRTAANGRAFIHLAIPRYDPTRPAALQAQVDRFYAKLKAEQAFKIPECPKPQEEK